MRNERWKDGDTLSIFIPMMHAKGASMKTTPALPTGFHRLAARQILAIDDASGLQIDCSAGSLWITIDHDPRDIVLEPGESATDLGTGRALVYALQDAQLSVALQEEKPVRLAAPLRPRSLLAAH
jgi:hypothetical protein